MTLLILGLVVFIGGHALTMARPLRASLIERLGANGFKIAYSVVALAGLIMIVYGYAAYRAAGYIPVWEPPRFLRHLSHLLMLPVFVLLVASNVKGGGLIKLKTKHPLVTAVKFWALAHLLSNGDLGSIILFGSLLAWAVVSRIAAKKRGDQPSYTVDGWTSQDTIATVAGLAIYVVFAFWLHMPLIGVPVFG